MNKNDSVKIIKTRFYDDGKPIVKVNSTGIVVAVSGDSCLVKVKGKQGFVAFPSGYLQNN